jgi:hypothetical protein
LAPKGGYDSFGVSVSTNRVVLGITASINCKDEKTAAAKKDSRAHIGFA